MKEGINEMGEEAWLDLLMKLTSFTLQELQEVSFKEREMWDLFQGKIVAPLKAFYISDIFLKYTKHMLLKLKKNGYQRV